MRESCACCARKHIAQAHVLLTESALGYPVHGWLAIGHLGEAEDELLKEWPELAQSVRETRLLIMDCLNDQRPVMVNLLPFLSHLTDLYQAQRAEKGIDS